MCIISSVIDVIHEKLCEQNADLRKYIESARTSMIRTERRCKSPRITEAKYFHSQYCLQFTCLEVTQLLFNRMIHNCLSAETCHSDQQHNSFVLLLHCTLSSLESIEMFRSTVLRNMYPCKELPCSGKQASLKVPIH